MAPTASSLLSGLGGQYHERHRTARRAALPVVSFTVQDKNGNGVPLSALGSISFTMAGPTTDYGYTSFGSDVTTPGYVTESAARATCDASGTCMYTFTHTVPAEGHWHLCHRRRGAAHRRSAGRHHPQQSIHIWSAEQSRLLLGGRLSGCSRRAVVALANCNQCHVALSLHGTLRNNTEYCVMCHNPSNTDASTRATATVAADKAAPPQGINFNLLVHRIHYGINMQAANRTYIVVGFGGSHNDFSSTLFPALSPTGAATDTRELFLVPRQWQRAEI